MLHCVWNCRFEKSVGPNWPTRQSVGDFTQGLGKENSEASLEAGQRKSDGGHGQYPVPEHAQQS